jgi:hypothetical protein
MSNHFYGDDSHKSVSFLEYGSMDLETKSKSTWGFLLHQDAYDSYMFSRYAKDMFYFRDFINDEVTPTPAAFVELVKKTAHKDLQALLLKYAGYMSVKKNEELNDKVVVCEIGSSLFGLIDEVSAMDRLVNSGIHIESIETGRYIGCDISDLMNKGAKEFHPNAKFQFFTDATTASLLTSNSFEFDLFYGVSISMQYSLRSATDMIEICKRSELSVIRSLWFSLDETRSVDLGTGKRGYNISLNEFIKLLDGTGLSAKFYDPNLYINKDTNSIVMDIIVGNTEVLDRFVNYYTEANSIFTNGNKENVENQWCDVSLLSKYSMNQGKQFLMEKSVIVFGTGEAAVKTVNKLNQTDVQISCFVDNDKSNQGRHIFGHKIYDPQYLLKEPKDKIMIIIASMYYQEISVQLEGMGFKKNENFIRYESLFLHN